MMKCRGQIIKFAFADFLNQGRVPDLTCRLQMTWTWLEQMQVSQTNSGSRSEMSPDRNRENKAFQ